MEAIECDCVSVSDTIKATLFEFFSLQKVVMRLSLIMFEPYIVVTVGRDP